MDVIPSEMFRGHLDTIILLSLVDEDKHTNQIRDEIEKRSDGKFELKQGTFYSCLQRIVKQGYVTEYRASTPDGRRKFLQLTEKGKTYIDDNKDKWTVSRSIVNTLFETPEKAKEAPAVKEPIKNQPETPPDFDIDSVLRNYLDSKESEPEVKETVVTSELKEEPKVSNNVTIIDLGELASTMPSENTVTTPQGAPKQTAVEKPAPVQPTLFDLDKSETPEKFEIRLLVGDSDAQPTQKHPETVINVQPEFVTEPIHKVEEKPSKTTEITEEIKVEEAVEVERNISHFPDPNSNKQPIFASDLNEDEDDTFGPETIITHDYKSVLEKLLRQNKPREAEPTQREFTYVQGTDIKDYFADEEPYRPELDNEAQNTIKNFEQQKPAQTEIVRENHTKSEPEVSVVTSEGYDFSDLQSLAKIEGFKVNISSGLTKRKVNSILINKLVAVSSSIFYLFCLAEIALLSYFTAPSAGLTNTPYLIFASVLALFPIISLLIYFIEPKKAVGAIPTMKSVIELCIVIMLNLTLITIVFSILAEIDFSSTSQILRYVLYPAVIILNIPIYFIIKYLNLENQRFFN